MVEAQLAERSLPKVTKYFGCFCDSISGQEIYEKSPNLVTLILVEKCPVEASWKQIKVIAGMSQREKRFFETAGGEDLKQTREWMD